MGKKIEILPPQIANKIAAGEVIQRPASVVKELLENAVDAGSKEITLSILDGGKNEILILDNGEGMTSEDAKIAFQKHATSKINNEEDLYKLDTYGFRGEALPSIATVAQVELITKKKEEELATQLILEEGQIKKEAQLPGKVGTQIRVKHLFFTLPARKHFLKSDRIEQKQIIETFQRIALARPAIAFKYYQDKKLIYNLSETDLVGRITQLLGKKKTELIPCKEVTQLFEIKGYIAPPAKARKIRGDQFLFINERYIRNHYLNQAIKRAFEELIAENSHPFFVLFITLSPHLVDVNIHPTKMEVAIQEIHLLYQALIATVKNALTRYHLRPHFFSKGSHALTTEQKTFLPYNKKEQEYLRTTRQKESIENGLSSSLSNRFSAIAKGINNDMKLSLSKEKSKEQFFLFDEEEYKIHQKPIEIGGRYLLSQLKNNLLLIDHQRAKERIIYEELIQKIEGGKSAQRLLFPLLINLSPSQELLLEECGEMIKKMGLQYKKEKPGKIAIHTIPATIPKSYLPNILEELLEEFQSAGMIEEEKNNRIWAKKLASHSARYSESIAGENAQNLIDRLFACENSRYTPHGNPIWRKISTAQLASILQDT